LAPLVAVTAWRFRSKTLSSTKTALAVPSESGFDQVLAEPSTATP